LNDLEAKPAVKTAIALADEEDKEKAKTPPTESESEELPASVVSLDFEFASNKLFSIFRNQGTWTMK
jgi:hypothetical protein